MKKFWALIFSVTTLTASVLAWVYGGMAVFKGNLGDGKVAFVSACVAIVAASISRSLSVN